jgi:hypothetical protein
MDKSQKQLVDTYFRKRQIAMRESYDYVLRTWELAYMANNNMIIPGMGLHLDDSQTAALLMKSPQAAPALTDYIDDLNFNSMLTMEVLVRQPSLIKYFDVSRLDYDDMSTIIMHHPDLLDHFDIESIDKYYGMEAIVKKHPGLRKYLENRLHKKFDKV